MNKKKVILIMITILLIGSFSELGKYNTLRTLQGNLTEDTYTVTNTRNGQTGEEVDLKMVDYLIEELMTAELTRKIELKPRGGWSYLLDIEIDSKNYSVVFRGSNEVKVNGATYSIDRNIN